MKRWLLGVFLLTACAGESRVVRVYDGRIVPGPFVPSEAYAAYLKGVLAEAAGDLKTALASYELASREDDEDPEPLTRIGDVRCTIEKGDRHADDAFASALRIDRTYVPALEAKARCASARGQTAASAETLASVAAVDRTSTSMEALLVKLASGRSGNDPRARERAIALSLASDEPAAWDALVGWGRAKNDPELVARGLENLVRIAPARQKDVEDGALALLGSGETALARRIAGVLVDATTGASGPRDATVARLAVDDALVAGDDPRAERRAIRGHVADAEVAARALLLERPDAAKRIAARVRAADPGSGCAVMVLEAAAAREKTRESRPVARVQATDRPAVACVLVFVDRLAITNAEAARTWMSRIGEMPFDRRDPLTNPVLADLAARGAVAEATLPIEVRLELAGRRGEAPAGIEPAAIIDEKHQLLWHVLADPTSAATRGLLRKLAATAERDPIVAFSMARAALASPAPTTAWAPVRRALAAEPGHPLLVAVGREVASRDALNRP